MPFEMEVAPRYKLLTLLTMFNKHCQHCLYYSNCFTLLKQLHACLYILFARDRPEVKNQSHVMVPNFRIQLPSSTPALDLAPGESETRLAELKHTCSEAHYRTGTRQHNFVRAHTR